MKAKKIIFLIIASSIIVIISLRLEFAKFFITDVKASNIKYTIEDMFEKEVKTTPDMNFGNESIKSSVDDKSIALNDVEQKYIIKVKVDNRNLSKTELFDLTRKILSDNNEISSDIDWKVIKIYGMSDSILLDNATIAEVNKKGEFPLFITKYLDIDSIDGDLPEEKEFVALAMILEDNHLEDICMELNVSEEVLFEYINNAIKFTNLKDKLIFDDGNMDD